MLDTEPNDAGSTGATEITETTEDAGTGGRRRRRAATRPAGPPAPNRGDEPAAEDASAAAKATKTTRKRATKKQTAEHPAKDAPTAEPPPERAAKATRKRAAKRPAEDAASSASSPDDSSVPATGLLFKAPEPTAAPRRRAAATAAAAEGAPSGDAGRADDAHGGDAHGDDVHGEDAGDEGGTDDDSGTGSRRRRRGGRGRRGRGGTKTTDSVEGEETADAAASSDDEAEEGAEGDDGAEPGEGGSRRRRRRRRRSGSDGDPDQFADDPPNTVTKVREARPTRSRRGGRDDDGDVRAVKGSTRLEAKKQRRREGREAGRRRPSIITEAEFLARRESVERVMVVRQRGERTQIAVLEDGVLAEHYVSTASSAGLVGNVYLGRVQNVLPSMEAAFVDIGKGRNAVLYAGEVNWDAAGLEGQPRRIELALKSGDPVLVQVTKDPIGHKGARLTSQVSLAGRYLVLVPGGSMTGISRKLPDTERSRLKSILKKVVPEGAGVIVRTAAEGASEAELSRDVARLTAQWEDIEKKSQKGSSAPTLLYGEPDMTIRVVRDIFNEDFTSLVVSGDDAWDMLEPYVSHVAPDLRERLTRWTDEEDAFTAHRVDEQLAKALDRKVWLPSGGYLVIDRTEAMVVVDVNTGKFTGQGGNLEETVTRNNLEAAEEIVRQLRLRDLGGIIVIDFIDMVLESNRDLVLRRLLECLGRDRTKHQVAEVTSLGLVQMTRKRVGQGLHEAFSHTCEACSGRGYHVSTEPVEPKAQERRGRPADGAAGKTAKGRSGKDASAKGKGAKGKSAKGKGGTTGADGSSPDGPSPDGRAADPVAVEDPVEADPVEAADVEQSAQTDLETAGATSV
jgi:ribonuclease E